MQLATSTFFIVRAGIAFTACATAAVALFSNEELMFAPGDGRMIVDPRSVVSIEVSRGSSLARCVGIIIDSRRVLSAAHCLQRGAIVRAAGVPVRVLAVDVAQDLVLMEATRNDADWPPPIPVQERTHADVTTCSAVVLLRPRSRGGGWRMTQSVIVSHSAAEIRVESPLPNAPCLGDSGGPLLGCDGNDCRLLGILKTGSALCRGLDVYTSWRQLTVLRG
jgi:hypothetical protein